MRNGALPPVPALEQVLIPTRTERHALAQSRRPMGMTRYSLRSENPGMSQPSRGLVLSLRECNGLLTEYKRKFQRGSVTVAHLFRGHVQASLGSDARVRVRPL